MKRSLIITPILLSTTFLITGCTDVIENIVESSVRGVINEVGNQIVARDSDEVVFTIKSNLSEFNLDSNMSAVSRGINRGLYLYEEADRYMICRKFLDILYEKNELINNKLNKFNIDDVKNEIELLNNGQRAEDRGVLNFLNEVKSNHSLLVKDLLTNEYKIIIDYEYFYSLIKAEGDFYKREGAISSKNNSLSSVMNLTKTYSVPNSLVIYLEMKSSILNTEGLYDIIIQNNEITSGGEVDFNNKDDELIFVKEYTVNDYYERGGYPSDDTFITHKYKDVYNERLKKVNFDKLNDKERLILDINKLWVLMYDSYIEDDFIFDYLAEFKKDIVSKIYLLDENIFKEYYPLKNRGFEYILNYMGYHGLTSK
ncbi:MAG: hypothetical protein R3Y64_11330, partial [Peptostreptococcaceae bacterium]